MLWRSPRCSVISSFNAVSRTVLVNCFSRPSGLVSDRPYSLVARTSSAAAFASADGSGSFFRIHRPGHPALPPGVRRTIAVARRRDVMPTHAGRELRRILLQDVHDAAGSDELPPAVEPL
jgi:hypothetical protein